MLQEIESRKLTEEEIKQKLVAAVDEAKAELAEVRKRKRDYLCSQASDASLELIRPSFNAQQQDSVLQLDSEIHEAKKAAERLEKALHERFPAPLPKLPPEWHLDADSVNREAARTGKTPEQIKAEFARLVGTPGHSGALTTRPTRGLENSEDGTDATYPVGKHEYNLNVGTSQPGGIKVP